jgi:hypothetical protein
MKKLAYSKKTLLLLLALFITSIFSGCSKIDDIKVKLGLRNNDFEYIKQNKISKIIIQNTRDKGFRFVVSDKKAISDLYDILSTAKAANEKSTLAPDYTFEMYEGSKVVHKFNYIAGLDKKDAGNFYNDTNTYIVSKRIDNDIIKSFWNIRSPKDFQKIYYESILQSVSKYIKDTKTDKKVGINLNEDIDVAKFILSTDLEDFRSKLGDKVPNADIVQENKEYDIVCTVKTQGYRSYYEKGDYRYVYKAIVTFWDKGERTEKKYYILDDYLDTGWDIKISEEKPEKF